MIPGSLEQKKQKKKSLKGWLRTQLLSVGCGVGRGGGGLRKREGNTW